jgi:hypothetical protein
MHRDGVSRGCLFFRQGQRTGERGAKSDPDGVTGCGGQHGLHRDQWNLPLPDLRLSRLQGGTGHAIINTNERLYRAGGDTINSMPPLSPIFGGGLYHTAHLGYWAVGAGHGVAAICVD